MDMIDNLCSIVGEKHVLTGEEISQRPTSFWDASPMQGRVLVRPGDTGEVSQVLALCNQQRQPVTVIGGNTGGVQGQHANDDELILSLERMTGIEEVDPDGATVTVEAGCPLQAVQQAVLEHGLVFPVDLGARGSCSVGGNVSTNAGGTNVIRYGMTRDSVLGLEAVLADGTVLSSMNRLIKNNTGYDLKQLFIGSEGTLGVVTRVVFKLAEAPVSVNTAIASLDTFADVVSLLRLLKRRAENQLTSFEYMDSEYYQGVTGPGGNRPPLASNSACYVVVETQGPDPARDAELLNGLLAEAIDEGLVGDAVIAQSDREREEIWAVRENFEPLLHETPYFLYDVSLPVKAMADYQAQVKQRLRELLPRSSLHALAHVGDNNLHWLITPRDDDPELRGKVSQIVYGPLAELDGSVSAEHGIGIEKKAYLGLTRNAEEMRLMKTLKKSLDPNNILGPGRIFDL